MGHGAWYAMYTGFHKYYVNEVFVMKNSIYCRPTDKGVHSFYYVSESREYYLFSQPYRKGVADYFGYGVQLDAAMKCSKAHDDTAILKTMTKIPVYVRYIEKEYGIEILKRTKKNRKDRGLRKAG